MLLVLNYLEIDSLEGGRAVNKTEITCNFTFDSIFHHMLKRWCRNKGRVAERGERRDIATTSWFYFHVQVSRSVFIFIFIGNWYRMQMLNLFHLGEIFEILSV